MSSLSANGLRIDTESVTSLLIGGIAFTTFTNEKPQPEAEEGTHFKLYETHQDARDDRFTLKRDYVVEFKDSVRGLSEGAPVEFRGIQIGTVVDFGMKADFDKLVFTVPVRIRIEPERLISTFAGRNKSGMTRRRKTAFTVWSKKASGPNLKPAVC